MKKSRIRKNGIAVMASMLLAFGIAAGGRAEAASGVQVSASADSQQVRSGDTVSVGIQLSNNTGLSTLSLALSYDTSVLSYQSYEWNTSLGSNDAANVSDSSGNVAISIASSEGVTTNGTLLTVHFTGRMDADTVPVSLTTREITEINASGTDADSSASSSQDIGGEEDFEEIDEEDYEDSEDADDDDMEELEVIPEDGSSDSGQRSGSGSSASASGTSKNTSSKSITSSSKKKKSSSTKVSSASSQSGERKLDVNYQTGIGFGKETFLFLGLGLGAVACGLLWLTKRSRSKKG